MHAASARPSKSRQIRQIPTDEQNIREVYWSVQVSIRCTIIRMLLNPPFAWDLRGQPAVAKPPLRFLLVLQPSRPRLQSRTNRTKLWSHCLLSSAWPSVLLTHHDSPPALPPSGRLAHLTSGVEQPQCCYMLFTSTFAASNLSGLPAYAS